MITADLIPSHQVASWLLKNIDGLLDHLGLSKDKTIEEIIYVIAIVVVAMIIAWLLRRGILFATRKLVLLRKSQIGQDLIDHKVLLHCSHIIPPLVILCLLPFAFDQESEFLNFFTKFLYIYTLVVIAIGINAVLTFVWMRFDKKENTKNLPLKGILNVGIGLVWIIVAIIGISIVINKSPGALLAGMGAFAAALMLVFKDSILGFVAGVQLSQNDMLRIGDWIVVPSTIANGIVIDMSLTAVKVQNWDNTIVTLPPYTLVSTSFQNWRGMSESGYRLISRSVIFDNDSVQPATPELIEKVETLPGMTEFVQKVKTSGQFYDPGLATVNGTLQTNLGLFRAYFCNYLLKHPLIGTDQQILVRVMVPSGEGIPLQIYCYTTTAWTAYEAVQSEIFEHISAMAPVFGLHLYNQPSGENMLALAGQKQPAAPQPQMVKAPAEAPNADASLTKA